MADFTQHGFAPVIRSEIRADISSGMSTSDVYQAIATRWEDSSGYIGGLSPSAVRRMITQENARQTAVDRLEQMDKRRVTNLHALLGCGKGQVIQTRITIQWYDEQTGRTRTFGHTTTLGNQGRLMDLLNPA